MLIPKPKFHQLAHDAVNELAKDGIVCAPDEILWLHEMAVGTVKYPLNDPSRFLDLPTPCGNVLLWPMSIGAKQWFESVSSWFEFDDRLYILARAYVMAYGRMPEKLLEINSRLEAVWKILRWSMRINCSLAELSRAMDEINEREEYIDIKTPKEEKEGKNRQWRSDWGEILGRLAHFYPGHTLAYWLWVVSDETAAALLDRSNNFLPLEERVSQADKSFREFSEFRCVVKYIRESRKLSPHCKESGGKVDAQKNWPDRDDGRPPHKNGDNQEKNAGQKTSGNNMPQPGDQ